MSGYNLMSAVQILQVSITPVILISGVGLIILSQTNRMGYLTGRIRQLKAEHEKHGEADLAVQVALLYKRAELIRLSVFALVGCILFDSLAILSIFMGKMAGWDSGVLPTLFFFLCLISLIAGLVAFLADVNMNLKALKIEIDE